MACSTSLQLLNYANWMPRVLAEMGAGWVKWLNPPKLAEDPFPGMKVDVRIWTDDQDERCIVRGESGGRAFVQDMLPRWREFPWAACYELANEPGAINDSHMLPLLRDYSIGAMKEADAQGIKVCIGQAPESSPHDDGTHDVEVSRRKALLFAPAVRYAVEHGHYLGGHLYWRPGVEGPTGRWHALGNVAAVVGWWGQAGVDLSRLQYLVTECGIDGGIGHLQETAGRGWRSLSSWSAYSADIVELERAARAYPWIEALLYFIAGHPGWADFDLDEVLMRGLVDPLRALSVPAQAAGLPEHERAEDPATLAEKARWWLEEEQRACEAGDLSRAGEIRLSLIRLLYRLEARLKVA